MTAPIRFPRFFVTSPAPCPYLPGRIERKVFTELKGPHAEELNDALGRIGFRRSQTVAYRPAVSIARHACRCAWWRTSSAVVGAAAQPASAMRDLVTTECRPWATTEQFELLQRYLSHRHPGGGMAAMDEIDYADMVEHTSVSSFVIEYREPSEDGAARPLGRRVPDRPPGRRVVDDLQLLRPGT